MNATGSAAFPLSWEYFTLTNVTTDFCSDDGACIGSARIVVAVDPAPAETVWRNVEMADVATDVSDAIYLDYTVGAGAAVLVSLNSISIENVLETALQVRIDSTAGDAQVEVLDSSFENVGEGVFLYSSQGGCNFLVSRCLFYEATVPTSVSTFEHVNGTFSDNLVMSCNTTTGDYFEIVNSAFVNCKGTCVTGDGNYDVHGSLFLGSTGAAMWTNEFGHPAITSSIFVGCEHGGLTNYIASYEVDRCFFWGNGFSAVSAGHFLTVTDSIFLGNIRVSGGGGAIIGGHITIDRSLFLSNSAPIAGGAVCVVRDAFDDAQGVITNSTFLGNSADRGSAFSCCSGESIIDAEDVFLGPQQTTNCPIDYLGDQASPPMINSILSLLQDEFGVIGTTNFHSWTAEDLLDGSAGIEDLVPTEADMVLLLKGHLARLPTFDADSIVEMYLESL